ncbi:ATP-binding protein [Lagierella sp.]|uniref:AAA family ATPase n=1 Tax=Lagierella sp. TaxID=2849657 RepID=UPI002611E41E|nr:ATP-binding protein [Lagierella sp.]
MLLEFGLSNWKSFKEENFISTISSREEQHNERRANIPKFSMNVLPAAGIFGGNASGKSNLIDALYFIRNLIVDYPSIQSLIPVKKYELDEKTRYEPTEFYLQMLIDDNIYHLTIELDEKRILREKLEFENSSRKHLLYDRDKESIVLGKKYKDNNTLTTIARGTRSNRLFLSNTIDQQELEFEKVFNWFKNLIILSPDGFQRLDNLYIEEYICALNEFLPLLDTGVKRVNFKQIDINNLSMPKEIINQFLNEFETTNSTSAVISGRGGIIYMFEKNEDNGINVNELITIHESADGEVEFKILKESMGTRQAMELIPLFYNLTRTPSVVIIDEIDRSLHTAMTSGLIKYFLNNYESNSRSQLIFTSHDTNLFTQEIFRRDELWVVERNKYNESNIVSVGDFKDVKKNHNLESLYLQGRLGGTPRINI